MVEVRIKTGAGKFAGTFENGVYSKNVRGSVHMLRSPLGWSIDKDIVDNLARLGCVEIQIFDKESKTLYYARFEDFTEKAIPLNRGFGEQLVLSLNYWDFSNTSGTLPEYKKQGENND